MGWEDVKTGEPWDPSTMPGIRHLPVTPVPTGRQVVEGAGKVLAPMGAMTGGAELGGALGAALAPDTGGLSLLIPALGAAIGSGTANVAANKLLPPDLGGNPNESKTKSFLYGAVPEGIGRGVAGGLEARALRKGAEAEHANLISQLKDPKVAGVDTGELAGALGRPDLTPPRTLTDSAKTEATNAARDNILDPINRKRRALGEPIGNAYKTLKGQGPIDEAEAADIAEAAQGVRDDLISPAPQAAAIFKKLKSYAPVAQQVSMEPIHAGQLSNPDLAKLYENIGLLNKPGSTAGVLPTPDELREVRQVVSEKLRSATGGDVHALLNLQQAIDSHLMPRLPANMQAMQKEYAGFIKSYPWRDINRLRGLDTPGKVSDWAFGGTPERALEIVRNSRGAQRTGLKEDFTDRILRNVKSDDTPENQIAAIKKAVEPYIQSGLTHELYGVDEGNVMRRLIYAPAHRARMAALLEQPNQQAEYVQGWISAAKRGTPTQKKAAQAGLERFIQSLPPQEQAAFRLAPVPGAEMPVARTNVEALKQGLAPSKSPSRMVQYGARRAEFALPMSAARVAMGGASGAVYGAATALTFGTIAAGSAGYRTLMENGGASLAARLYSGKGGRMLGRLAFETMAAFGAAKGQQQNAAP